MELSSEISPSTERKDDVFDMIGDTDDIEVDPPPGFPEPHVSSSAVFLEDPVSHDDFSADDMPIAASLVRYAALPGTSEFAEYPDHSKSVLSGFNAPSDELQSLLSVIPKLLTEEELEKELVDILDEQGGLEAASHASRFVSLLSRVPARAGDMQSMLLAVLLSTASPAILSKVVECGALTALKTWLTQAKRESKSLVRQIVKVLSRLPATFVALRDSEIGKAVKALKAHSDRDIQDKAAFLVTKWVKLVQSAPAPAPELKAKSRPALAAARPPSLSPPAPPPSLEVPASLPIPDSLRPTPPAPLDVSKVNISFKKRPRSPSELHLPAKPEVSPAKKPLPEKRPLPKAAPKAAPPPKKKLTEAPPKKEPAVSPAAATAAAAAAGAAAAEPLASANFAHQLAASSKKKPSLDLTKPKRPGVDFPAGPAKPKVPRTEAPARPMSADDIKKEKLKQKWLGLEPSKPQPRLSTPTEKPTIETPVPAAPAEATSEPKKKKSGKSLRWADQYGRDLQSVRTYIKEPNPKSMHARVDALSKLEHKREREMILFRKKSGAVVRITPAQITPSVPWRTPAELYLETPRQVVETPEALVQKERESTTLASFDFSLKGKAFDTSKAERSPAEAPEEPENDDSQAVDIRFDKAPSALAQLPTTQSLPTATPALSSGAISGATQNSNQNQSQNQNPAVAALMALMADSSGSSILSSLLQQPGGLALLQQALAGGALPSAASLPFLSPPPTAHAPAPAYAPNYAPPPPQLPTNFYSQFSPLNSISQSYPSAQAQTPYYSSSTMHAPPMPSTMLSSTPSPAPSLDLPSLPPSIDLSSANVQSLLSSLSTVLSTSSSPSPSQPPPQQYQPPPQPQPQPQLQPQSLATFLNQYTHPQSSPAPTNSSFPFPFPHS